MGGVSLGEDHAVFRQFVDVRGFVEGGAVTSNISAAEIIDEKDDYVGLIRGER
mgnify:CR=1 FL=1